MAHARIEPSSANRRLESWKEIAAYLGRNVRTVQRWEATEQLPVHRLQHAARGTVFALTGELDTWRQRRTLPADPVVPDSTSLRTGWATAALSTLAVTSLLLFAAWLSIQRRVPETLGNGLTVAPLPFAVDASEAALSGDGRSMAFVEAGALKIRRGDEPSSRTLVGAEAGVSLFAPVFVPGGTHVTYLVKRDGNPPALYRVSLADVRAEHMLDKVWSGVAVSPDGQLIAFVRKDPAVGRDDLLVATADGSHERVLLTRHRPEYLETSVAWSPDGTSIAVPSGSAGPQESQYIAIISVRDGHVSPVAASQWVTIRALTWPQRQTLFLSAAVRRDEPLQVWRLLLQTRDATRLTSDLASYHSLSMTADMTRAVAIQSRSESAIWVGYYDRPASLHLITRTSTADGMLGVAWTAAGRLLFSSLESGNVDVWVMDADGTRRRQLTTHPSRDFNAAPTPDDGLVFVSERSGGRHVWRMTADGEVLQLTHGALAGAPQPSPDGRWIAYVSLQGGAVSLWRKSLPEGDEKRLAGPFVSPPGVARDGSLAFLYQPTTAGPRRLGVIRGHAATLSHSVDVSPATADLAVRWTPDDSGVIYVIRGGAADNLWVQPLDGGPQRQLTAFESGTIARFDVSRDGRLAISRAEQKRIAVSMTSITRH